MASPPQLPSRYRYLGPIGRGGMGEVYRVEDIPLERSMALKVLRLERVCSSESLQAFVTEAKATAKLQHPGIVPVHDVGILPDGRPYFTMTEVTGRTLSEVISAAHNGDPEWSVRRLTTVLQRVASTVAFAHSKGVVHQDLKPSNIMVGAYGEVMVMDWGLAVHHNDLAESAPGRIRGTPAYMSPEQAMGSPGAGAPGVDIYALGAILYQILSGRPPYPGGDVLAILAQVRLGSPPAPDVLFPEGADTLETTSEPPHLAIEPKFPLPVGQLQLPPALTQLCQWTMDRTPENRPQSADLVASELQAFLDGARRREEGLRVIEKADALLPEIAAIQSEIVALRHNALKQLNNLPSTVPANKRFPAWNLQDKAHELEGERDLKMLTHLQLLRGALTHDPELPEAHRRLANTYRERHVEAESKGVDRSLINLEVLLNGHDREGHHTVYLKGEGSLTVHTSPPGATVELCRFEAVNRYLNAKPQQHLGQTPINEHPLPMGRYLLTLTHPDCETVRYPVYIQRLTHWKGAPPGSAAVLPILLPPKGSIGDNEIYVPPGYFWSGGDRETLNALPKRRLWLNGFVIGKYPVTVEAYLAFLNALIIAGNETDACRLAPQDGRGGAPIFSRDKAGLFTLGRDALGILWQGDWPVVLVDWSCAQAFAAHERARLKLPYRLPWELEWEKAARGVDARTFPWGETFSPAWACIHSSHQKAPTLPSVYRFPMDRSPYGAQGMAGGVRDWCQDAFTKLGYGLNQKGLFRPDQVKEPPIVPLRVNRGGGWLGPERFARTAFRYGYNPAARFASLGFRLCRALTHED